LQTIQTKSNITAENSLKGTKQADEDEVIAKIQQMFYADIF
jgi:hypothetical protein